MLATIDTRIRQVLWKVYLQMILQTDILFFGKKDPTPFNAD